MTTSFAEPDTKGRPAAADCLVVGAGLAGLAAAHALAVRGRSVVVIEAEDGPGGRARSTWHDGRPVDRGFQALFSRYPETRRFLRDIGLPSGDLRPFAGGAAFYDGSGWSSLSAAPASLARFSGMTAADRLRFVRLAAEVAVRPAGVLLARGDEATSTEAFLRMRGFSERAIEGLFRPLFGVIFLDRALSADPGYFLFLMSMLVRGPSVLPSDGLGMMADWAAAAIRQRGGLLEFGVRAQALTTDTNGRIASVRTDDGRDFAARQFVVAVEAPAAARLLRDVDPALVARLPTQAASVTTARFALARSLYSGRTILVNAAQDPSPGPRIDLLCQTTNVTRPGAVGGPHILLATSVTTPQAGPAAGVEEAVENTVRRWSPGFPFARFAQSLGVVTHPFAQYRPSAGVRRRLPGARTAVENLVLAGDLTHHPSIEGAITSGREAARVVDALLA